MAKHIAV